MIQPNQKKVVLFSSVITRPVIGRGAIVVPIDHTSPLVSNKGPCLTSHVLEIGDNWFETENSRYVGEL